MPRSGAYAFLAAPAAVNGLIEDENKIEKGEWAWLESGSGEKGWKSLYARCPDCGELCTLWCNAEGKVRGHQIDAAGNVTPSVLHSWIYQGVERCGFHTFPTKLLGFVDRRS